MPLKKWVSRSPRGPPPLKAKRMRPPKTACSLRYTSRSSAACARRVIGWLPPGGAVLRPADGDIDRLVEDPAVPFGVGLVLRAVEDLLEHAGHRDHHRGPDHRQLLLEVRDVGGERQLDAPLGPDEGDDLGQRVRERQEHEADLVGLEHRSHRVEVLQHVRSEVAVRDARSPWGVRWCRTCRRSWPADRS